jgi:tRNASer (uridine44-2'-O)-methyltransferase
MLCKNKVSLIEQLNLNLYSSIKCEIKNTCSFDNSIKVYINKPQVVNKWVAGSVSLDLNTLNLDELNIASYLKKPNDYELLVRKFVAKNEKIHQSVIYLIVLDYLERLVVFKPFVIGIGTLSKTSTAKFASASQCHAFKFDENEQAIKLYTENVELNNSLEYSNNTDHEDRIVCEIKWLAHVLLNKLKDWCLNIKHDDELTCQKQSTLTLYENMLDDYTKLYTTLKDKYWDRFSVNWQTITNTDPKKFVIEDVSIATYMILAWRHLNTKVKCFVDLGCGNGLLVYILNDQGYNGYGIDMRKRKIWSNESYSKANIKLIESTIDPRSSIFEDCDWLIGNHSDELTPWLSIIATKTSQIANSPCNIFLIPCCLYDFNSRYNDKNQKESRYDTYLNYIEKIMKFSSFQVYKDKLRIPSTKSFCFTCIQLAQPLEQHAYSNLNEKDLLLKKKVESLIKNEEVIEFQPRDCEKHKNKNLTPELRKQIMLTILQCLLKETSTNKCTYLNKNDGSKWNCGRKVTLNEIAGLFDKEILNKLKEEPGGLRTLIKTYYQLFFVQGDDVSLKVWSKEETQSSKRIKISRNKSYSKSSDLKSYKTKDCLFYLHHPDGCILDEKDCRYIH